MPQANITYDVPYNRKLVDILNELDEKHWRKAGTAYAPTMFSEKLGNFHGAKIGGGSPANQQYILSGNSPAYPPIHMNSGLAVHSGGAYAGIDGAVGGSIIGDLFPPARLLGLGHKRGGYSFNDFLGDAGNVGKELLPLAPLLMGLGHKKRGKKSGGSGVGDTLAGIAKTLVPFAPLLLGLGHPVPRKKMDIVSVLAPLGAKKSHTFAKLHEIVAPYKTKTGGFSFGKLIKDLGNGAKSVGHAVINNPIVQEVGKDLLKQGLNMGKDAVLDYAKSKSSGAGRRRKKGGAVSGGADLESMVEMVRPMDMAVSKGKGKKGGKFSIGSVFKGIGNVGKSIISNPIVKEVGKDLLKEGIKTGISALTSGAGGRAKRAEIVKRVMREKGMKMIEASKYVKAHGLY
jgi:hypothetical protein